VIFVEDSAEGLQLYIAYYKSRGEEFHSTKGLFYLLVARLNVTFIFCSFELELKKEIDCIDFWSFES